MHYLPSFFKYPFIIRLVQLLQEQIMNNDAPSLEELFMELASDTRRAMLEKLDGQDYKLSKLASDLDITIQEAHRNTARLTEVGIIKKDGVGSFSLTEFGRALTRQFSYFQFLNKHRKFLEEHTFENMPEKFVQRLGAFQNCELIRGVSIIMEKLKKIESSTSTELKLMATQAWSDEGNIVLNLLKKNVPMYFILGKNTIFPDEVINSSVKEVNKLLPKENFEMRRIDNIFVAVYITDSACGVMFPRKNGEITMNSMFLGNDDIFREWCQDIFDHYWRLGKPFALKNLTKN